MRKQALTMVAAITALAMAAAIAALALGATRADAATTRYASVAGGGTAPCTNAAAPCTLPQAVAAASSPDEVLVRSGTYQLSATLNLLGITVRGATGAPRPRIIGAATSQIPVNVVESTLRHLTLEHGTGTNWTLDATNATLDSLIVRGFGPAHEGMVIRGQTVLRNTVATTSGTVNPAAILGVDGHFDLLNVTAWSTSASSTGIAIRSNTEATSATIRNTIAYGVTDISAVGTPALPATVVTSYDSLDTKTATNATISQSFNQTAAPKVVNAASGDVHQLSSSPTIDAGTASGVPAIDYDGDLRDVGADPDIGADERTPAPYASTLDAVDVGATVARIRGSIGPAGSIASWRFNWGKTLAYELTPFQIFPSYVGPDIFGHIVDLKLTNLQPSTTYHFRVRAANVTGSGIGSDKTLTTGAPNTPDPGGSGPDPGTGGGGSGGGGSSGGGNTGNNPPGPITLGKLKLTAKRFRAGKKPTALVAAAAARKKKAPVGTTLKVKLSGATTFSRTATLTIFVEQQGKGRRKGKDCVKASKAPKSAKRCTRWVTRGTLVRAADAGTNKIAFSGRLGKKKLKPAKYRFRVTAADAGATSKTRKRSFSIV
jgi:hypothetical protein